MFGAVKFASVIALAVFAAVAIAKPSSVALVDSTNGEYGASAFSYMMWYDGACAIIELGIGKIIADGKMCTLASRQAGWTMRVRQTLFEIQFFQETRIFGRFPSMSLLLFALEMLQNSCYSAGCR